MHKPSFLSLAIYLYGTILKLFFLNRNLSFEGAYVLGEALCQPFSAIQELFQKKTVPLLWKREVSTSGKQN